MTENAKFMSNICNRNLQVITLFWRNISQQLVVCLFTLHLDLWKKSRKRKKNIIKIILMLKFCRIIWINYNVNENISQQSGYGCLHKTIQFNIYHSKFTHTNISYLLYFNSVKSNKYIFISLYKLAWKSFWCIKSSNSLISQHLT